MTHFPPFSNDSTSREAAASIAPFANELQERVYNFIRDQGGATDDEIRVGLNMLIHTVNPRRWELRRMGRVADSGLRRPTERGRKAIVWRAL